MLLHDRDVPQPVLVVWRGADGSPPVLDGGVLVGHQQDAVGLGDLQRMEEHTVHAGDDRSVAAQTDRERRDGGEGEAGILAQNPDRQFHIVQPAIDAQRHAEPGWPMLSRRWSTGGDGDVPRE